MGLGRIQKMLAPPIIDVEVIRSVGIKQVFGSII
jgi:hypothetical protein